MISSQQTPHEWVWFMNRLLERFPDGVSSFLEIGSCQGYNLIGIATSAVLKERAIIRSVDLANHGTAAVLTDLCAKMDGQDGLDVKCLIGNSRDGATEDWCRQWAPYDVVFIDGDHEYDGVSADWAQYGPMGKVVAFHDVGNEESAPGCVRLWAELTAGPEIDFDEYVADQLYHVVNLGPQGIGIIYR